jgi:hypothetical protein
MPKRELRNFTSIEEWDRTFFPVYTSKTRLANFEGDPAVLAGILAEEALQHAASQLTTTKKSKRSTTQPSHK